MDAMRYRPGMAAVALAPVYVTALLIEPSVVALIGVLAGTAGMLALWGWRR